MKFSLALPSSLLKFPMTSSTNWRFCQLNHRVTALHPDNECLGGFVAERNKARWRLSDRSIRCLRLSHGKYGIVNTAVKNLSIFTPRQRTLPVILCLNVTKHDGDRPIQAENHGIINSLVYKHGGQNENSATEKAQK